MGRLGRLIGTLPTVAGRVRAARAARGAPPRPALWGLEEDPDGRLLVGGCRADVLAKAYGTPLHVADASLLRSASEAFLSAFESHGLPCRAYYSYKTNPVPGILRVLEQAGIGAEVTSAYELWLALESGIPPERILYNGPGKDLGSLRVAIERQIRRIHLDSFVEIDRVEAIARELGLVARVAPRVCTGTRWSSPFGFQLQAGEARSALERIAGSDALELDGVHAHIGSILRTVEPYEEAARDLVRLLASARDELGLTVGTLNLGGGFAVPNVRLRDDADRWAAHILDGELAPGSADGTTPINSIAANLAATLRGACARVGLDLPQVEFEPGRILTSAAQVLLTRVEDAKARGSAPEVLVLDAGISAAAPITWEVHEILPTTRLDQPHEVAYRLVGPTCTPADEVSARKVLPRLEPGDFLAIMDAGAYFTAFETEFAGPRPAIALADGGKHCLVRQRETFESLMARD